MYGRIGPCDTTNCIYVLHTYITACIVCVCVYTHTHTHNTYTCIHYMRILCTFLGTLIYFIYSLHIHTYIKTYIIHTYIHTYIHTCTHAGIYVKMHSLNSSSKTGASSTHSSPCVGLLLAGQQLVRSEWSV